MLVIITGVVGLLSALLIHWLSWYMRQSHLSLTGIAGAVSAAGLTLFCLLFLTSDIANMMLGVLALLWLGAVVLGAVQARALRVPWWKGLLAIFFEMALAFLVGAAVNLTLQSYIPWLNEQFPGLDVYALIDAFLRALAITLVALAVIRPLDRLYRPRAGSARAD